MGLSQRFQNLIMDNRCSGAKSLRCVDLTRQLFGNTATPPSTIGGRSESAVTLAADAHFEKNEQAVVAALKLRKIRLPSPIFTFQARTSSLNEPCKIDCFPVGDRKMVWADDLGRPFLFDPETRKMDIMPNLHKPKSMPFSLFVPNVQADDDDDQYRTGSSLFIMERIPKPETNCSMQWSDQFEAFVYRKPTMNSYFKSWQCQLLPSPPYVRELKYWHSCSRPEISSYAVLSVGGNSHICISVDGIGTYYLDMASHTWIKVGEWTLPFHGRVEYVPELKLWFGFTAKAGHLAAADLSAMDSQPQLVGSWKELYFPEEWKECKDPQLVNLGFGRFCITRFFDARTLNSNPGVYLDQNVAVFTGVEMVPLVRNVSSGKVELQMIPFKSLGHVSNSTIIDAVF